MKTAALWLLIVSLAFFATACESGPQGHWVKDARFSSRQQVDAEHYECLRDASYRESSTVFAPVGNMVWGVPITESKVDWKLYNFCMAAKGFRWVSD